MKVCRSMGAIMGLEFKGSGEESLGLGFEIFLYIFVFKKKFIKKIRKCKKKKLMRFKFYLFIIIYFKTCGSPSGYLCGNKFLFYFVY